MKKITLFLFIILTGTFSFGQECWKQVSNGGLHVVGIKEDGTLWSWGSGGGWGRLGHGNVNILLEPTQIGTDSNWDKIYSGATFVLALKTDGTLWTWGGNANGQLGLGLTVNSISTPTQIGSDTWKTFAASQNHALAIKSDGTLWAWGYNDTGALGDGTLTSKNFPVEISNTTDWKEVNCDLSRSIAIKEDNTLWTWGSNAPFLGLGWDYSGMQHITTPTQLGTDNDWKTAEVGFGFSMAIKLDHTLWGWGGNGDGQLGNGTNENNFLPTQIGTDADWDDINVNWRSCSGIKTNGTIWTWGNNEYGQIGNGNTTNQNTPFQVTSTINSNWLYVGIGPAFTIAVTEDKSLFSWGWNFYGQLGNGTTVDEPFPTLINNCALMSHGSEQMMEVSLYPNPTQDHVNLSIQNNGQYELYALNGMLLQKGMLEAGSNQIRLADFASGNYLLKVMDEHGNVEHLKLIKQ